MCVCVCVSVCGLAGLGVSRSEWCVSVWLIHNPLHTHTHPHTTQTQVWYSAELSQKQSSKAGAGLRLVTPSYLWFCQEKDHCLEKTLFYSSASSPVSLFVCEFPIFPVPSAAFSASHEEQCMQIQGHISYREIIAFSGRLSVT